MLFSDYPEVDRFVIRSHTALKSGLVSGVAVLYGVSF